MDFLPQQRAARHDNGQEVIGNLNYPILELEMSLTLHLLEPFGFSIGLQGNAASEPQIYEANMLQEATSVLGITG